MFTVQTVKEKTYTAVEIQKMVTNLAPRTGNGFKSMGDMTRYGMSKVAMKLISAYTKKNRWELFQSFAPYKIITNGYGEFTYIEMSETGIKHTADYIFRQMRKDEENGCTIEMVKV